MLDLRTEYLASLAAIPAVEIAEPHDGEFDGDEIARLGAARTPAAYVACMGLVEPYDDGGPSAAMLQWVAMVVARGPDRVREGKDSAGDLAALIALRFAHELETVTWVHGLERPSRIRARNLFGSAAASRGYRLWGVEWRQPTVIRPEDLDPVLHDLRLIHTKHPNLPDSDGDPTAVDVSFPAP